MISETVPPIASIEEARQPLLDALASTFALYGWSEVMGRMYGLLAFADQPLSQDDLAGMLGVSKATVSTNMRQLESLHFVHRVGGGRDGLGGRPRLFYRAERDFKKVFQELIHHNVQREVKLMGRGIEECRQRLQRLDGQMNGATGAQIKRDLELVSHFDTYLRLGRTIRWLVQSGERLQGFLSSLRPTS